ncbi:glycosyltransferase family 4 protein [Oceanobacillus manasiensis]|uniref:glycosyltransferase family 4 protein n=1 Tax=Oceanobacillus manasiensis TaxID=586413 RepID=UPI0005A9F0E1|nr:glycosyltransferase family 4 protein [Oceanobacillus manasiensis]
MKKIMFLESRYDSFYGAQKSMLKLIQGLDSNKFSYKVVTTGDGKLMKGLEENNVPVDVLKLGEKANVFGGKVLDYSIFEKIVVILQIIIYNIKLIHYIKKNNIDIVYVNDLRAFLYSVIATKLLRKKNVWYIRADITNSFLTNLGLRFSNKIITIAHGVLEHIPQEKIEKFNYKITNIYTGFDFDQYKIYEKKESKINFGISTNKHVIGYLGSINERKGLDVLIDSYIEVSKIYNDLHLLLIGDVSTGYEEYWEQQSKKLESEDVAFSHQPFRKNVSQAFSAMDTFVLPSNSEGLPRVVIEAMGHKLPVIATDVGGTKEVIPSDEFGIIIRKGNTNELIHSIKLLKEDKVYRSKLSQKGQEFCKTNFSNNRFVREINDYFGRI